MVLEEFYCDRKTIEGITSQVQQNLLIQQYCADRFLYMNIVDFYYRVYKSNAIFTLFLTVIIFLLFLNIFPPIIYRMLCPSVLSTINSLKISNIVASLTITAIINMLPVFYTFSQQEGNYIRTNFAEIEWVLAETFIVLNLAIGVIVLMGGKQVILSKWIFLKDSIFILSTIVLYIIYGFIGKIDYILVTLLILGFFAYMVMSFLLEHRRKDQEDEFTLEVENEEEMVKIEYEINNSEIEEQKPPVKKEEDGEKEKEEDEEEDDENTKRFDWERFFEQIKKEVTFPDSGFIMNCVLVPPMVFALLSIPYYRNPLMKTKTKYLVYFLGSAVILFNFSFGGISLAYRFFVSFLIAGFYFVLHIMNINKTVLSYSIELLGYLSAISYSHILLLLCLDSLSFLGFYFSGNESLIYNYWPATISGSFMLFTAIGYSNEGKTLLGIYSCYSSIIIVMTL